MRCNMCTDNNTCVDEAELLELLKTVVDAYDQGVVISHSQNVTSSQWTQNWDLTLSIYFVATILTTIGSSACCATVM